MSVGWEAIPLLPLRCVLEHLSVEDALAAMSTCRHWRSAILIYEGHKHTLKLRAKQLNKCMFLTRIFKKHVKKLEIFLDCCEEPLEKFMTHLLPQFFDTIKLEELIFIEPGYIQQSQNDSIVKLKRVIAESLIYKHSHCLQRLAMIGCKMDTVKNDRENYTHKLVEYYSRPLSFSNISSPADSILSTSNINMTMYSMLRHIIVDYDQINTQALQTLGHMNAFSQLTLNITRRSVLNIVDWRQLSSPPHVYINVIEFPAQRFNELIENVLVEDLVLTSLKVMFCKILDTTLLRHVVRLYKSSLRELVWADSPVGAHARRRDAQIDPCNVNPFILLCWQCEQLRRLVIHGYWVWQYDVVGFVRLRALGAVELSAVQPRARRAHLHALPVLASEPHPALSSHLLQQINSYTEFKWAPLPWDSLHPALRSRSQPHHRADYVLQETLRPGVT